MSLRQRLKSFTRIFVNKILAKVRVVKKIILATSYSAALTYVVDNNCEIIEYFCQYIYINILGIFVCLVRVFVTKTR